MHVGPRDRVSWQSRWDPEGSHRRRTAEQWFAAGPLNSKAHAAASSFGLERQGQQRFSVLFVERDVGQSMPLEVETFRGNHFKAINFICFYS